MYPLIALFGDINIPTYYFVLSLTSVFILFYTFKRSTLIKVNSTEALDILMLGLISGTIGARLLHVFYENPEVYSSDPIQILYFWKGGFVYYGGFFVGMASSLALINKRNLKPWKWFDFFAPILSLGYALGRFACLFAGCCYGKATEMPWGFAIQALADGVKRHPTQIYSIFWELGVFCLLIGLEKLILKKKKNRWLRKDGDLFYIWITLHALGRIIMEFYRDDFRGYAPLGISLSTWISIILVGFGLRGWILSREPRT